MKNRLHHVGGIGTNHHQLAMRHIDHAHQAVGNGQTQGHQQQNRAQADAAEDRAQTVAPSEACFDLAQALEQRLLDARVGLDLQALGQQRLRRGLGTLAQECGSFLALGRVFAGQQSGGTQQCQGIANVGFGLLRNGFVNQRELRITHLALQGLGRVAAYHCVGAEQFERCQRVVQFTAHAVVDHGVFCALQHVGGHRHCGATGGVRGLAIAYHHRLAIHNFHEAIRQRLDKYQGLCVWTQHCILERSNTFIALAHRHFLGLLRAQRVCCCCKPHASHEQPQRALQSPSEFHQFPQK